MKLVVILFSISSWLWGSVIVHEKANARQEAARKEAMRQTNKSSKPIVIGYRHP